MIPSLSTASGYADPLPTPTAIISNDISTAYPALNDGSTSSIVAVVAEPFSHAIKLTITKGSPAQWQDQLLLNVTQPVTQGDAGLLTFWVKADAPDDGSAKVGAFVQQSAAPNTKCGGSLVAVSRAWTKIGFAFTFPASYAPGQMNVTFFLAYVPQVVEIADVNLLDYGQGVNLNDLPEQNASYDGRDLNAPWRKIAAANIERYRKVDVSIKVVNSHGKPIRGAIVTAKQLKNSFEIGTAVNENLLFDPAPDAQIYRTKLVEDFNYSTEENGLKSVMWYYDRQAGIDSANWLLGHGLGLRGHNLVWPSWGYQTKELHDAYNQQVAQHGQATAVQWLSDTIDAHITDEVSCFKNQVFEWDVVNEPFDNHDFQDIIGPDAIVHWFHVAHSANPKARLFVNEYGNIYGENTDDRVNRIYRELQDLIAAGAPVGGVGFESHLSPYSLPSIDQLNRTFQKFSTLKVPLRVTEFDLVTSDKQLEADYTRDFLTVAFSQPNVLGFSMWGFWDGSHWLGDAPLYNKNWTLKPSGKAFMDLINSWKTNSTGHTNASGQYRFRGFNGTYSVTITFGSKTTSKTFDFEPSSSTAAVVLS